MKRCMPLAVAAFAPLVIAPATQAGPPQGTWDWYNIGETHLRYPDKDWNDLAIATRYFRRAADGGNDAAAYKLGEHYENGIGVRQDQAEALKWYRASAAAGNRYAQFKVGEFLQNGKGAPKDAVAAAEWYQASARQGDPWAYHMLGFMLAEGEGVARDEAKAREFFELSLPHTDDHWAKWKLALLLKDSDPDRAKALLTESAAAGNRQAEQDLAAMP